MIGLIIKTLNTIPIVSALQMAEYRQYLATNYPQLTFQDRERVLSQLVNEIIDNYLSQFSPEFRQPLKDILFENGPALERFTIYASDIFKAGLKLADQTPAFIKEIATWTGQFEFSQSSREAVVAYLLQQKAAPVPAETPLTSRPDGAASLEPTRTPALNIAVPAQGKPVELPTVDFNPYVCPTEEQEVIDQGASGDYYQQLVAWFEMGEKFLQRYLSKLAKDKKTAVSAGLALLLLATCLWLVNHKARGKELPAMALQTKPSISNNQRPRSQLPEVTNGAQLTQADAKLFVTGSDVSVKPDYHRPTPIPAAPNTIVVGYVKMKTPEGLVDVPVRRYFERKLRVKATAYDLSVASCGKDRSHPEYGITRTGTRAKRGRTIAVDPKIIPLGRKVYIVFPEQYRHMNGIYIAEDTGKKIKGYRIDIFFGEDRNGMLTVNREARKFGRRKVEVYLLQDY